jgi:hypothetical protein
MKLEENIIKTILEIIAKKAAEQELREEQISNFINVAVKAVTTDGLANASTLLADALRPQIPEMIARERDLQAGFEQRLYDRWKKALDLYEAIIILTRECGVACVG